VYVHTFNPEITRKVPTLKHYRYSYLDREIVLIDGQEEVVAVIPLPAKYVPGSQGHHGAAEPAGESSKDKDGGSPTGSVPAYTSPETIK
jgi:hypothetical protein